MKYENNTIKISFAFIICIVFLFVIFLAKLCYINLAKNVEGTNLTELALSRRTQVDTIGATRGSIYDYQGNVLATNVNSYTLIAYLDPSRTQDENFPEHVVDKLTTAQKLSEVLLPLDDSMTVEYILGRLSVEGKYQVEFGKGGSNLSELLKGKIESLMLPGIDFIKKSKRYYPYGDFASYIIGYSKYYEELNQFVGELGIEGYVNRYLTGEDGEIVYQKDRYGYRLADHVSYVTKEVKNGYDIYLTLDSQIQMFLDDAVKKYLNYNIDWVSITIADAKTGAILGSSSSPSYNPNELNIENYNNPLTSYTYEPGSTMKIFSFMSAIEEGIYNGDELYKSGTKVIDDFTIGDWNRAGWGNITYDVGFTYSSNIAASNLAEKLGINTLIGYYEKLGFGKRTGIELANEYVGDLDISYRTELTTAAYGQGITITPVQMIQALTSLTNDGTTLKPYIIDKIIDPETDEVVYSGERKEVNKVWSTATVNKIIDLMDKTVNSNDPIATGRAFQSSSVRLIGKTGTSDYVEAGNKTYTKGTYLNIRSFAGVFPKDDPKYIIYIAVKDFHGNSKDTGSIISSLVDSISKYKNLDELQSDIDASRIIKVPHLVNHTVESATGTLASLGAKSIIIGDGDKVISMYPKADQTISFNTKVFLLTNGSNITLPNMVGWSRKEVSDYCDLANYNVIFNGYGYVNSINIKEDNTIEVNLEAIKPKELGGQQ